MSKRENHGKGHIGPRLRENNNYLEKLSGGTFQPPEGNMRGSLEGEEYKSQKTVWRTKEAKYIR